MKLYTLRYRIKFWHESVFWPLPMDLVYSLSYFLEHFMSPEVIHGCRITCLNGMAVFVIGACVSKALVRVAMKS